MASRKTSKNNKYVLTAKSEGQQDYLDALNDRDIKYLFCTGVPGSGKTMLAAYVAAQYLTANKANKIVLCRSVTPVRGESIGYLKGGINEKLESWLGSITQHLVKFLPDFHKRVESGDVEFVSLAQVRGRSFDRAFVICDEAQNISLDVMKCLLTRLGGNSFLVCTGDAQQKDVRHSDFYDVAEALIPLESFEWIELGEEDIVRSKDIAQILKLLKPLEK